MTSLVVAITMVKCNFSKPGLDTSRTLAQLATDKLHQNNVPAKKTNAPDNLE